MTEIKITRNTRNHFLIELSRQAKIIHKKNEIKIVEYHFGGTHTFGILIENNSDIDVIIIGRDNEEESFVTIHKLESRDVIIPKMFVQDDRITFEPFNGYNQVYIENVYGPSYRPYSTYNGY